MPQILAAEGGAWAAAEAVSDVEIGRLSAETGLNAQQVKRWLSRRILSLDVEARALPRATRGEVAADDMLELEDLEEPAAAAPERKAKKKKARSPWLPPRHC